MSHQMEEVVLFLLRWIHFGAGITWIGLLYYFNFVQIPYFGETKTGLGTGEFRKLVDRALWWFRWGAMLTFLSGIAIIGIRAAQGAMSEHWGVAISAGAVFGILMFLNVWLVIWPNQKIVIASADNVAGGGAADPAAAGAGARAFLASRTNTLFSVPMLFFMGAASHLSVLNCSGNHAALGAVTLLALAIEGNALMGKKGEGASKLLDQHGNVLWAGLAVTAASAAMFVLI